MGLMEWGRKGGLIKTFLSIIIKGLPHSNGFSDPRAKMPAVLSEIGFITNPVEEKLLKQDSFRQIAAESLLEGIINYFNK